MFGRSPRWSLSKHEAEADYHEHTINFQMMSPISIATHEVNVQNEWKLGHSQTDSKYGLDEQYHAG
jgi:hypothetical protein